MNYTIDHTVLSYLMDRNGEYLDHLASSMNAKDLAERVSEAIKQDMKPKI